MRNIGFVLAPVALMQIAFIFGTPESAQATSCAAPRKIECAEGEYADLVLQSIWSCPVYVCKPNAEATQE